VLLVGAYVMECLDPVDAHNPAKNVRLFEVNVYQIGGTLLDVINRLFDVR
jgi:hypothetical protein